MGAGFFKASYFHDLSKVSFTSEQEAAIRQQIASTSVLIYSKDYCPHCSRTKEQADGLETQAILRKITGGQKTVPYNFIGGKVIGGNQDLQALYNSGELKKLLDEAGVAHNMS